MNKKRAESTEKQRKIDQLSKKYKKAIEESAENEKKIIAFQREHMHDYGNPLEAHLSSATSSPLRRTREDHGSVNQSYAVLRAASVSGNRSGLTDMERTALSSVIGGNNNKSRLSNGKGGGGLESSCLGSHVQSAAVSPFEERRRKGPDQREECKARG